MSCLVSDIMDDRLVTAADSATIAEVLGLALRERADEVYIVDAVGRLLGAVPDYELLKARINGTPDHEPAVRLMSPAVRTVASECPLDQITLLFRDGRFRQLAVVERGRLVGVLLRCDVLRRVCGQSDAADYEASATELPRRIIPRPRHASAPQPVESA